MCGSLFSFFLFSCLGRLKTAVAPRVNMSNKFIPAAPDPRLSLPESDSNRLRVDDFVVYFPGRSQFVILTGGWSGSRLMTRAAAPQRPAGVHDRNHVQNTHLYSAVLIFALVRRHVA